MLNNVKNTCFTDENTHPFVHSKHHRVYVQNVPVVPANTETFWTYTRGCFEWTHGVFQRFTHTDHTDHTDHTQTPQTPHPLPHSTHHNNTTTTPHENRERDRDRQRQRHRERRRRQKEKRREETREDSFFGWWCMAVFCWCSDFLGNSVCARDLSLLNSVKIDPSLISCARWQVNSFLVSSNYLFCAVTVCSFFFDMQLQFQNFQNYLLMQLQFLSELILHKYSVEG